MCHRLSTETPSPVKGREVQQSFEQYKGTVLIIKGTGGGGMVVTTLNTYTVKLNLSTNHTCVDVI